MNWRTATIIFVTAIPVIVIIFLFINFHRTKKTIYEKCESDEVCVRYCCGNSTVCEPKEGNEDEIKMHIAEVFNSSFRVIKGNPCKHVFGAELDETTFLENGHIVESEIAYHWDEYCVEVDDDEVFIKLCAPDNFHDEVKSLYIYFIYGSMPFLIITLAVYGFIRDLRNLHGKCLIAYVASLTIMYTTLIINGSPIEDFPTNYTITCITVGYTFLTSVLCCFFWLNVMCYDIYRTFKEGMKTEDNIQFLKYCAYAFGIPVTISFLNFILNNFELIPDSINNGIGNVSCSIPHDDHELQWIYVYGPIVQLLAINVSFYGTTAWKIFHVQKETSKVCKTEGSRRHTRSHDSNDNYTRFFLYMRLSIVMGVPWIFEIWSFIHVDSVVLFIVSIFNCMQGFVVFITFVWNPKVTKQLMRRYTAMSVSYKHRQSAIKRDLAKEETVKNDSVETVMTRVNGITSESSAQV